MATPEMRDEGSSPLPPLDEILRERLEQQQHRQRASPSPMDPVRCRNYSSASAYQSSYDEERPKVSEETSFLQINGEDSDAAGSSSSSSQPGSRHGSSLSPTRDTLRSPDVWHTPPQKWPVSRSSPSPGTSEIPPEEGIFTPPRAQKLSHPRSVEETTPGRAVSPLQYRPDVSSSPSAVRPRTLSRSSNVTPSKRRDAVSQIDARGLVASTSGSQEMIASTSSTSSSIRNGARISHRLSSDPSELSTGDSSGYTNSTRESIWSSHRASQHSSWDMHGSDFIAPGFYDNQAKDLKQLSHHALEPEDFIGVGMSQEVAPPSGGRSSRTAVMAPYDASSSPSAAGRWAHHRAPSWTHRAATTGPHPVSQQQSEVHEHLANEDSVPTPLGKRSKTVPVLQSARPSPARMLSEDGAATATAGPDTGSVEDASVTIPPRVQSARSRTTSSSSRGPMPRTTSSRSITSTLSTSPSDEFSGAIRPGVSPRKSSLRPTKQLINAALGQNPMPVPIRKASIGAASSNTGDASEMSHDADGSSRYSVPSSRRTTNSSRTWLRSPTDSLVINSDQTSVDVVDELGDEFAHLVHSPDLESAQAVKVIEDGQGVIIEAKGRALESLEREVGPNTTHLLLSGSQDPELMSFLERSLPVMSQSLLVLDLSHTSLAELPVGLQSCSKLEELNISRNQIQRACLPSWIGNISSLRVLIADDLGLVSLPYSLTDLYSLSILSIRRNKLDHLPTWLHLLTKLERLLLEGNAFKGAWARVVGPGPSKPIDRSLSSGSLGREAGSALRGHFSPSSSCDSAYQKLGQSPASALRSSMFSGDSPVDPVSPNEVAQRTLRKPKLGRMRSDFDLRLPSTWKGGNVGPDESCDSFETASSSQTKVEELTPRSKATTPDERVSSPLRGKGDRDGKWGLLRKVGRKASSSNSRLLALGTADHEDDLSGKDTVGRGVDSFQRRAVSASVFMTGTGVAAGMTPPPQQAEKPKATLGAAWQPTPHNVNHLQTRRKSFLPLETALPTQHAPTVTGDDPRETQARVKALLCYLRDLDDLAPGALARRTGELDGDHMSSALRDSQSSHSLSNRDRPLSNATDMSRPSPIERMRSNPLLRTATSSSTDSPAEIKDDTRRRRRIIEEIISSEESYIKWLQELCDIYVKPARLPADGNSGQPILSPAELRAIFGNVEGLLQFHSGAFLPSLKTAAVRLYESDANNGEQDAEATAKVAEGIAAVFLKHGAFFRMYSAYINGCDAAQTKLAAWLAPGASTGGNAFLKSATPGSAGGKDDGKGELSTSQKKKFKAFMRKCRADPRHRQLNIDSYLLLPVQRIPRYELLLKDLTKSTDPRRLRDPTSVQAALTQISSIANSVNESKRQSEQDRKLMAWQARISGKAWNETPLLQPHRRLVKDGALTLLRIVYRQGAFETTVNLDDVEENLSKDGAFAPGVVALAKQTTEEQGRWRVDCLSQKLLGEKVTMLLCNDLCAVVKEVNDPLSRTPGSSNGIASPGSVASPPASVASPGEGPVELFTTLKMRGGPTSSDDSSTSVPSSYCQLSGPTLLRIVDGHQIFYFSTTTHREAKEWCEVLNSTMVSGGGIMAAGRRRRSSAADWLGGSV